VDPTAGPDMMATKEISSFLGKKASLSNTPAQPLYWPSHPATVTGETSAGYYRIRGWMGSTIHLDSQTKKSVPARDQTSVNEPTAQG
jgi:hypothetical protein